MVVLFFQLKTPWFSSYKLLNSKDPPLTSVLVTTPLVWGWTHGKSLAITWVDLNSNHCLATSNGTAWFTFLRVDEECLEVVRLWAPLMPCKKYRRELYWFPRVLPLKLPCMGLVLGNPMPCWSMYFISAHPKMLTWGLAILGWYLFTPIPLSSLSSSEGFLIALWPSASPTISLSCDFSGFWRKYILTIHFLCQVSSSPSWLGKEVFFLCKLFFSIQSDIYRAQSILHLMFHRWKYWCIEFHLILGIGLVPYSRFSVLNVCFSI